MTKMEKKKNKSVHGSKGGGGVGGQKTWGTKCRDKRGV